MLQTRPLAACSSPTLSQVSTFDTSPLPQADNPDEADQKLERYLDDTLRTSPMRLRSGSLRGCDGQVSL
jgi:hypothetical protein